MRVGDDLGGQGQVGAKVFNTFVRQVAVVVLPREGDADESTRFQTLHEHEDFEVRRTFNLRVRLAASVLPDNADSFLEKIAEYSNAAFLGNKHDSSMPVVFVETRKKFTSTWVVRQDGQGAEAGRLSI